MREGLTPLTPVRPVLTSQHLVQSHHITSPDLPSHVLLGRAEHQAL